MVGINQKQKQDVFWFCNISNMSEWFVDNICVETQEQERKDRDQLDKELPPPNSNAAGKTDYRVYVFHFNWVIKVKP